MPKKRTTSAPPPTVSDDPVDLAAHAREAVEKNAVELRKPAVPIAAEPPTVYRP